MTALSTLATRLRTLRSNAAGSATVFARDVGHGLLEVSHNTLALVGLILVALVIFGASRDGVRHQVEVQLFGWLQQRHEARQDPAELVAAAVERAVGASCAPPRSIRSS